MQQNKAFTVFIIAELHGLKHETKFMYLKQTLSYEYVYHRRQFTYSMLCIAAEI